MKFLRIFMSERVFININAVIFLIMRLKIPFVFIAIILIISVLFAGCTGLPGLPSNTGAANSVPSDNSSVRDVSGEENQNVLPEESDENGDNAVEENTPVPNSLVTPATPIPTENANALKYHIPPPENEDDGYVTIFTESKQLSGVTAFDYFLKTPPMVFYYDATVPLVNRTKTGTSEFGEKEEFTVEVSYPSPLSYYKIVVYDKDTSKVLAEYVIDPFTKERDRGSFKYLSPGNLHVEITGAVANVTTEIEVPRSNLG